MLVKITPKQQQILFSVSTVVLLTFLTIQILNINSTFILDDVSFTDNMILEIYQKNFFSLNSYTDFELVDENTSCSKEFSSVLDFYPFKHCKCGDIIYLVRCSYIQEDVAQIKGCHEMNSQERKEMKNQFALLESGSKEVYKPYKLCGKQLNSKDIRWYKKESAQVQQNKFYMQYKQCLFNDTYLFGLVGINSECPQNNEEFSCHTPERKCVNGFYLYCGDKSCEDQPQCKSDEIGCYTKQGRFCLKNSSKCPVIELEIRNDEIVSQGYTELPILFPSQYKFYAKRNSLTEIPISSFSLKSSKSHEKLIQNIPIPYSVYLKINKFAIINEEDKQISGSKEEKTEDLFNIGYVNSNYDRYPVCQNVQFKKQHQLVLQSFNKQYYSRLSFIVFLIVKLLLEFINYIAFLHKNKQKSPFSRSLYILNISFFFFMEIFILVLVLTEFRNKEIEMEESAETCLREMSKFHFVREVIKMNRINLSAYIFIILFAGVKGLPMILLIWNKIIELKNKLTSDTLLSQVVVADNSITQIYSEQEFSQIQNKSSLNIEDTNSFTQHEINKNV